MSDTDFMVGDEVPGSVNFDSDGTISLDFTGVKAVDFQPVPPGSYLATIIECTPGESKDKKTPYIKCVFELFGCVDNPAPEGAERCPGKKVWGPELYLTAKSMPFNKPFFDALAGGEATSLNFTPAQLVGTNVGLVLTKGSYIKKNDNGTTEERFNNQILGYFPATNV